MLLLIELALVGLVLSIWWYTTDKQRYKNSPPGPIRFPFIGNILQIVTRSTYPAIAFKKLSDFYGDIMFLKMGPGEAVIFSSSDSIEEMLNHEKASNRIIFEFIKDRHDGKNLGLIWGNGKTWQNLRRYTMRNLRDYGFGKTSTMDAVLNEEFDKFSEYIRAQASEKEGNIVHVEDLFSLAVVNVLWRLMTGTPYEYSDPRMIKLLQLNSDFFKSTNMGFDISDCYPILRDWLPNWTGRTNQIKTSRDLYFYGDQLLQEHKELGTYKNDPDSFLDTFRAKVEKSRNDPDTDYTDEQFVMVILDLLIAGSETSSNTLTFGVLYMLLYPEIQEKVQSEIDHNVPKDMEIDSTMKPNLPYTAATILEIFRYSTIVPTPAARETTDDFYFKDYFIRKGTSLIFNVYAVHYDENLWGDPHNFRPERFLDSSGTGINQKLADKLQVFGAGKRICIGQSLAEASIFIYFASTMRRFKFVKVPGTNPTTKPILGVTTSPYPFDVRILDRNRMEL